MTHRRGFTLVEVLFATVILTIVLLSTARFVGQFMHTVSTTTVRTVASEVASERIERVSTDPSYLTLSAQWAGTTTGFPGYPNMARRTTVSRVTGSNPTRDYTIVSVQVTEPTMGAPVNMTTMVARP
jgi:prepilin-type N-terminal cleavage/methylation domain-containing protein